MYKIPKTGYFGHKKFLLEKPVCYTKTFLDRNKFPSQKKVNAPEKRFFWTQIDDGEKNFFRKQISIL